MFYKLIHKQTLNLYKNQITTVPISLIKVLDYFIVSNYIA